MSELLFEIGTEEIPSDYIIPALEGFVTITRNRLEKLGLEFDGVSGYATPRRLAVCASGLPVTRPKQTEQVFGPPKAASYGKDGTLSKAAIGFAKSKGADPADIKVGIKGKGEYIYVEISSGGEPVPGLLASELPKIADELPFPKSMRWGDSDFKFTRPVHWIVALFGGEVIPCTIGGAQAGQVTYGHRFLSNGPIHVLGAGDYLDKLRKSHVEPDVEKRKQMVISQAREAARANGATLVEDDGLATTVACLVEWPTALWGSFDEEFLALPEELLTASMKNHQKMFTVKDAGGKLTNGFIGVSNMKVEDESVVSAGYRRVLRARLNDAKFFFDEDLKHPLDHYVEKLSKVVYHNKLGTVGEKVERFTSLAAHIARTVAPDLEDSVRRSASLCKADLETLMVFEFPELQGIMGREYARIGGEPEAVCQGICESYKPRFSGDRTANGTEGAIVGIADRLDTLAGCFGVGIIPTGAQDPFALRRGALGIIQTILEKGYRVSLSGLIDTALLQLNGKLKFPKEETSDLLQGFFAVRLKNLWTGSGVPHDLAEAILACGMDDLAETKMRLDALTGLTERPFFTPLATTFKRASNISKDTPPAEPDPGLFDSDAEKLLYEEVKGVENEVRLLTEEGYYLQALERLAGLRSAVDRLFDEVMIMTEDLNVRNNRLVLLSRVVELFKRIADFSKIESQYGV